MISLDAAATAPLRPEALQAMWPHLTQEFGNASSVHSAGHRARAAVEAARVGLAELLGARPADLIFTSGGTEAANLAIIGLALANPRGRHLVASAIEHPSVLESCRFLVRHHGFTLTLLSVDSAGRVPQHALAAALTPETSLVSVGLANNEVGTVQNLEPIVRLAHESGALVHTDAVQAVGQIPVSFRELGVDALTCSAHKLGGPQGVGAALIRRRIPREAVLHGGGQERGSRSGTENVAGVVGFAAAAAASIPERLAGLAELQASRDRLLAGVEALAPASQLTGHPSERLPGHASWVFPGVSGEAVLVALDAAGVLASSGSACAAGQDDPSHVLLALGLAPDVARTGLRFSFQAPLSGVEEQHVLATLAAALTQLGSS